VLCRCIGNIVVASGTTQMNGQQDACGCGALETQRWNRFGKMTDLHRIRPEQYLILMPARQVILKAVGPAWAAAYSDEPNVWFDGLTMQSAIAKLILAKGSTSADLTDASLIKAQVDGKDAVVSLRWGASSM
jgi:hypothetical protein